MMPNWQIKNMICIAIVKKVNRFNSLLLIFFQRFMLDVPRLLVPADYDRLQHPLDTDEPHHGAVDEHRT